METYERINLLDDARMEISSAIRKIRKAIKGTSMENRAESYIIGHLSNWANNDSPSMDETIPVIINQLENERVENL